MILRPRNELWAPKQGNFPDEYEDAFRCAPPEAPTLIAVADGASEAAFAREWANALVDAWVAGPPELAALTEESLTAWLAPAQEAWSASVPWERLPWHGEAKARAGAFATLLGLAVSSQDSADGALRWRALAVGDSCLFVVRDGALLTSFPLDDASQFDNNPDLICSNPANAGGLWDSARLADGECAEGDLLILASDALSRWFLAANAEGERPWEQLAELDAATWEAWLDEQRSARALGNDDVTLAMFEVAQDAEQAPR